MGFQGERVQVDGALAGPGRASEGEPDALFFDHCHLTLDGQEGVTFDHRETARVERGPYRFELLHAGEREHFEVLRAKLAWGDHRN